MCEISNSKIQRFQSWYFPDKPYMTRVKITIYVDANVLIMYAKFQLHPPYGF